MANISHTFGRTVGLLGLGGTNYWSLNGEVVSSAEERMQRVWLKSGKFRKLRFVLDAPVPTDNQITWTLRIDEVDSLVSVTLPAGATEGVYLGSDVIVAGGNRVNWKATITGTGIGLGFGATWNVEFEPLTGSASCYGANNIDGTGGTPLYYPVFSGQLQSEPMPVERAISIVPCPGTFTDLAFVNFENTSGTSQWVFYKSTDNGQTFIIQDGSGGTPDTRMQLTSAGPRYGFSSFSLPVNAGDLVYIRHDRLSGVGQNLYGGVSCAFTPTTAGQFIVAGSSRNNDLANTAIGYMGGAAAVTGVSFTPVGIATPLTTITVRDLYGYLETPPGDGKSYCFDYALDDAANAIAGSPFFTVTGSSTPDSQIGNDTTATHWIRLGPGHTFVLRDIPTGTPTAGVFTWAAVGTVVTPIGLQTGCGCGGCAEPEVHEGGNIGPIAWIVTRRVQP